MNFKRKNKFRDLAKPDIQKYKYRLIIALYPSNVFSPHVLLKV